MVTMLKAKFRKREIVAEDTRSAPAGPDDGRMVGLGADPVNTVIVPAFNEEGGVGVVLKKLSQTLDSCYEIVVVDDGSTDKTADVARQFPCSVISHSTNLGKAEAVKTGIIAARGRNVIVIDADDTYPVDVIPDLADALNEYDMVVTSRSEGRENIPWLNRFGNYIFRSLIRYLYGFMPRDPLTGLYGLKRETLLSMHLDSTGFGAETELTIKAGRMGLRVHEIPIMYRPRIGEAKLHGLSSGYRILRTLVKALALFSPTAFFILPGVLMFGLGLAFIALLTLGPVNTEAFSLRSNALVVAAMLALAGFQTIAFGIGLDLYASTHRFTVPGPVTRMFLRQRLGGNMGRLGILAALTGVGLLAWLGVDWVQTGFGPFGRTSEMVIASFLAVLGLQVGFSSSFLSVFVSAMRRSSQGT